MADGVLSIRVTEETQQRFKEFVENGEFRNQKDFMNHLLTQYALQETKQRIPTLESAITAVSELSERINKVLIGAGEMILVNEEKLRAETEVYRQEAERRIKETEEKAAVLEAGHAELMGMLENTKIALSEAEARAKNLDGILDDKAALIDEYRVKIGLLEAEMSRQRQAISDAKDMRNELESFRIAEKEHALKAERAEMEKSKALIELEAKLRQEMSEAQTAQAQIITEMQATQAQSLAEYREMTARIEEKNKAIEETEKANRELETEVAALRQELEKAKKSAPASRSRTTKKADVQVLDVLDKNE